MKKIEALLGIPQQDPGARRTFLALLHQQMTKLKDERYKDLPPGGPDFAWIDTDYVQTVNDDQVGDLKSALPGHVKDHPLPALLIAAFNSSDDPDDGLDHIIAKTVHLSLMLAQMGPKYDNEIVIACRRARLLLGRDNNLLRHLPSFRQSFQEITEGLKSLADSPPSSLAKHEDRLCKWHDCFKTFVDQREKHTRQVYGSDVTLEGERVEHLLPENEDVSLSVCEPPITVPFPNSAEEAQSDQPKAGKAARPLIATTPNDRSRGMAHNRGREIVHRLFMDSLAPPCHDNRLTTHQVRRAFEICYRHAPRSEAHLMTALVILTGRPATRLSSLAMCRGKTVRGHGESWVVTSHHVYLRYEPELPEHDKVTRQKGIKKISDNGVYTVLPTRLGNALVKLYRGEQRLEREIDNSSAIAELSQEIDKKITVGRLSHALPHTLDADGIDDVLIAWLSGGAPKQNAGMYYTLISRTEAAETHAKFVNTLLEHAGERDRVVPSTRSGYVGTRLRINPAFIVRSFRLQARELESALQNSQAVSPFTFHNRFVLYIAQLLGMVTLIRSVTEPFGLRGDTNLMAQTMRIADKVNRLGVSGRLIALGKTATAQLEKYNQHLDCLSQELQFHEPDAARDLRAALDGSGSYLVLFDDKHKVVPVRPKLILEALEDAWPFPTNWPRHSLSAWIRRQDFSKGAIRGAYGHADFGPAPLSRFDGTTVLELTSIADAIDDYLAKHDIRSINGWNTRT